jgi:hypothetical protein
LFEAWHPVDFRRTLLDFIIDVKPARENPCLNSLWLVLIRKLVFSDKRDQPFDFAQDRLSAFSNQLMSMTTGIDPYFCNPVSSKEV